MGVEEGEVGVLGGRFGGGLIDETFLFGWEKTTHLSFDLGRDKRSEGIRGRGV
jgi:hypothetical protein